MPQSGAQLELRVLGHPELRYGETGLKVPKKGLALLCYLALEKRPVSRQELSELLWPGKTRGSLRVTLSELRRSPGSKAWLRSNGPWLALHAHSDVQRLEQMIADRDYAGALALWNTALPGGEMPFHGLRLLELPEPFNEDWLTSQREYVGKLHLEALMKRALQLEQQGELKDALDLGRALVGRDPLNETATQLLMRLEFQNGNPVGALARFELFCQLVREVRYAPLPATQELARHIEAALAHSRPPGRRERLAGQIEMSRIRHFKGRDRHIAELKEMLGHDDARVVQVIGPRGGIGKTALVIKVLRDFLEAPEASPFQSFIYLPVREAEAFSIDQLLELLYRVLEPQGAEETRRKWAEGIPLANRLEYLFHRTLHHPTLIVLDNAERLLTLSDTPDGANHELDAFVKACLDYDHPSRLLVASRRPLSLKPQLAGRSGQRHRQLTLNEGLPTELAVELLRELDSDGRERFRHTEGEVLRELVHRCHGIPRVLEALVGTLRMRPTLGVDQLFDEPGLLKQLAQSPAQELHASLGPAERTVMEALAIYGRPVEASALRHMLPDLDPGPLLDALVGSYVVTFTQQGQGDFSLHPLDEQYVYEQIPDDGPNGKAELHRRAAAYYRLRRRPEKSWKRLEDVQPQLREFQQLVRAGDYDHACRLLNDLDYPYLLPWNHLSLVASLREQLVGHLKEPTLRGRTLNILGLVHQRQADLGKAVGYFQQALAISREQGDRRNESNYLGNLGLAYNRSGHLYRSIECHLQALAISRSIGDRRGEGIDLGCLGLAYHRLGESEKAVDHHLRALAISREIGDRRNEGNHLANLGNAYSRMGRPREALDHTEQALALHRERGDRRGEAIDLNSLGNIHSHLGDAERARNYFLQALALNREIGERIGEADTHADLGDLHMNLGQAGEALENYRRALEFNLHNGDRHLEGVFLRKLAAAYLSLGERQTALALSVAATAIFSELESPLATKILPPLADLHREAPEGPRVRALKNHGDCLVSQATGQASTFYRSSPAGIIGSLLRRLASA